MAWLTLEAVVDHLAGLAGESARRPCAIPCRLSAGCRFPRPRDDGRDRRCRAEDQEARRDLVVDEVAARAEKLQPAIVVDEFLAEIGRGVGLPPAQVAARAPQAAEPAAGRSPAASSTMRSRWRRQASGPARAVAPAWPSRSGRRNRAPAHQSTPARNGVKRSSSSSKIVRHAFLDTHSRTADPHRRTDRRLHGGINGLD